MRLPDLASATLAQSVRVVAAGSGDVVAFVSVFVLLLEAVVAQGRMVRYLVLDDRLDMKMWWQDVPVGRILVTLQALLKLIGDTKPILEGGILARWVTGTGGSAGMALFKSKAGIEPSKAGTDLNTLT